MAAAVAPSSAPPEPCTTRAAISTAAPGANPDSTEPAVNVITPIRKNRVRPRSSASRPKGIKRTLTASR